MLYTSVSPQRPIFYVCFPLSTDASAMGVKMLQCFPFYRRCKERCKSRQCPPAAGEKPLHYCNSRISNVGQNQQPKCDRIVPDFLSPVPIEDTKPRLCSTTSWSSDSEGAGSLSRNSQIYFSSKARLSFRHQLDSNINAVDATYWEDLQRRHTDSSMNVFCCLYLLGAGGADRRAWQSSKHIWRHRRDVINSSCQSLKPLDAFYPQWLKRGGGADWDCTWCWFEGEQHGLVYSIHNQKVLYFGDFFKLRFFFF